MTKKYRSGDQCARKRIIKLRGHNCERCGYPGYIELHHILEVNNGGKNHDDNLVMLCEKCHAVAHGYKKKKYLDTNRPDWY